ncbi:tumor necrosis factor receptor superfamily member 14-like isoform X4 [Pygocentrus nattereri]|uniref:tumor necrosis factor receptor superfamily member 14-like isoform X4 n=1 Tax=Pygocentrus nattereri TaxID=42514 RepID=UPI00189169F4|nr:tumor necrosis factor receptor superfamily member 14-like isoform X4 [Pygocentrus nattereri]
MLLYDSFITWLALLKLIAIILCRACDRAEYEISGECCPLCSAGQHVYKHCSGDSSTTCVQCSQSTYIDFPNNFISCISCTLCDEGIGLRTKQECQSSADTLCEPLLGYYCIETHGKNCRKARQHSTCLPGQYINKTETFLLLEPWFLPLHFVQQPSKVQLLQILFVKTARKVHIQMALSQSVNHIESVNLRDR